MSNIKEFQAVFNPFTKTLCVLYGGDRFIHSFQESEEWWLVPYKEDSRGNYNNYLHIHLSYDESLQLAFYPRDILSDALNEKDGEYFNSSCIEETPECIKIAWDDFDFDKYVNTLIDTESQYSLFNEMVATSGINIVTCSHCGSILLHRVKPIEEDNKGFCKCCSRIVDYNDCPDLFMEEENDD